RTEPGLQYTIQYSDTVSLSNPVWTTFTDLSDGVGTWIETNTVPGTRTFIDDFSPATSGGLPANGRRLYRVRVNAP
ncbi:MAG: hypothetical protein AAF492_30180, partial [Verrucomicrobiota bacterium]